MPFPESKRVVFRNNPLVEVICQLRFPTILEIGAVEPVAFQNLVRSSYPLYEQERSPQIVPQEVTGILEQLRVNVPVVRPTHKFSAPSMFISLNPEFVAVTDKSYERWERFRQEITRAKAALEEIYEPAFYLRIGLRYQDVIDKTTLGLSEPWDVLVNPSLIGPLGAPEVRSEVQEIRGESLVRLSEVPGGHVRIRHGLVRVGTNDHDAYVIDADFYTKERTDAEGVLGVLDDFRRLAGNLFRWAILPPLREALEPVEIE